MSEQGVRERVERWLRRGVVGGGGLGGGEE